MLSTLTLKEHYALDAVTGATLGLAAWWWWRKGVGGSVDARAALS
jgi:hypothetical protein